MHKELASGDLITWTDDMAVGCAPIDGQHQFLINGINNLWVAMLEDREEEGILELIHDLNIQMQIHFRAEEVLMRSHEYPNVSTHRESHREFAQQLCDIVDEFAAGKMVGMDLLQLLSEWIKNHVKVADCALAHHIRRERHGRVCWIAGAPFRWSRTVCQNHRGRKELSFQGLDMKQAIGMHTDWIRRLDNFLNGTGAALDPREVGRDDLCLLGNWIKTNATGRLARLKELVFLRDVHSEFHRCAAEIITLHQENQKTTAEHLLRSKFRNDSNAVRFAIVQLYTTYHH